MSGALCSIPQPLFGPVLAELFSPGHVVVARVKGKPCIAEPIYYTRNYKSLVTYECSCGLKELCRDCMISHLKVNKPRKVRPRSKNWLEMRKRRLLACN